MYSFKEKQKHFSELQNPDAASLDLKLLIQKNPLHPHLGKFTRNPQRYANEILYQLLDIAKRDEIRNNRRPSAPKDVQPNPDEVNISNSQQMENDKLPAVDSEKVKNETTTQAPLSSKTLTPEQQDKISDVTNQIVEAEERAEEAEERAEEAELRAEEAEERADNAETALEEEKKKVVTTPKQNATKSKNTKSIPKLTGTISPIRKSRQPRSSTTTGS